MRQIWAVSLLAGLAACSAPSEVPSLDSGVGFGSYTEYKRQIAEREAREQVVVRPGPVISDESRAPAAPPAIVAAAQPARQPIVPPSQPVPQPVIAPNAAAPAPAPVTETASAASGEPLPENPTEVVDETSFERVTAKRTIEGDAERLERNRELYVIIEPTDLPRRPGSNVPNIVAYALATNNLVGIPLYSRGPLANKSASERACKRYVSDDLAQEAFLAAGGPKRDSKRLDPDGDGFACNWDPTPFRSIRN